MMNSFLRPIQRLLKQRDLKVSDRTIKGFLEDIDQAAPWFRVSGDVNLPCWDKLGRDLTEAKGKGELRSGTLPLWRLIRYCLKEGKCVDILHEGRRALSAHQDSMSESDNKEKGNLKEERPKSSKASSKLHTKVEKEKKTDQGEKEKETDQGKAKQKHSGLYPVLDEFKQKHLEHSGLYPVLDEFSDLTLSDSAEDELESEEEKDLEEAAATCEQERFWKGIPALPPPRIPNSEARTALAKVETAITNAQLNRIDDSLPLLLCVLPTKIFPTAVLWQKGPLLWIHSHASPGKTIEHYPTSVASLALQGIKLALIHFATEPQLLIQPYTPKQVQILAATVDEWAVLVCSFSGVLDNHYPKDNLLLFITHHPVIFPKVTAMEPLKGAIEIYTDGSKSGVGAYLVQGQETVQFRFQSNTSQIVECQIVYEVFKRFHESFNLLSDSHYAVNAVRGLETSAFIKENSPVHDILWNICVLIRERITPFFIGHIRAHTLLPGPMTAANDLDQENPIWIPERLTRFIRHEDPDPDTSDKPDSSSDQSRTRDAVVGSDQNVADPDATECWSGNWTLAVIVKVPTFVPIPVKVDPKTFPIMTLLRERRDFGITAVIIAAIVLSAAGAITATVAMTNQIQSAQTINTVVEQTSAVMETQHRINKHLSGIVAANQRMDLIQTQVEELFGMIQIGCIAKLKHMCVILLRFEEAGNESREIESYLAGNWTRDIEH
ncbi:hypothetical protein STEG23_036786 [Scotinomys teguina]